MTSNGRQQTEPATVGRVDHEERHIDHRGQRCTRGCRVDASGGGQGVRSKPRGEQAGSRVRPPAVDVQPVNRGVQSDAQAPAAGADRWLGP